MNSADAPCLSPSTADNMIRLDTKDAFEFWLAARQGREARLTSSREAWESEVEAMTIQLSAARLRLNAFCPIYTLPNEILARVFELLSAVYPFMARRHQWGWACVTQVCRRFRAVAIDHALLWSELSVDGETPWPLFLSRARGSLLRIYGEVMTEKSSDLYAERTLKLIERVQTIEVDEIISDTRAWHQVLRSTAPQLRTLRLRVEEDEGELDDESIESSEFEDRHGPEGVLDSRFLTQGAPELRSLSLSGIQILWKLDTPIILTSLSLRGHKQQPAAQSSDVLRYLQNMPLLQDLDLAYILPPLSGCDVDSRVRMVHLRRLSLEERDRRCLDLWASIDVPTTCSISISPAWLEIEGVALWRTMVLNHLTKDGCPTYRRVRFEEKKEDVWLENAAIRFSLLSSVADEDIDAESSSNRTPDIDGDATLSFRLSFVGLPEPFGALFEVPHPQPNHDLLNRGQAWAQSLLTMRCVNSLLSRNMTLEAVELWGSTGMTSAPFIAEHKLEQVFYACFLDQIPLPTSSDHAKYVLPNVHTLSLRNGHLGRVFIFNRSERLYDVLTEALRCRYFADMPIRTIDLSQTKANDSRIRTWENYVDEVYCDEPGSDTALSDEDGHDSEGSYESEDSEDMEEFPEEWDDDEEDEDDDDDGWD